MYKYLILGFILPLMLFAKNNTPLVPPEVIAVQLEQDEAEFNRALKMFNPWYTGPLITPGVSMMPVGMGNSQPYLFLTNTHSAYNSKRKSVSLSSDLFQLKGAANIQTGITNNLDLNISFSGVSNWQHSSHGGGYGDMSATAGLLIHTQTPYTPQMKFTIVQTFPTGKYKNLSWNGYGLNATGGGVYATQFGLGISKVIFWATEHPMNLRAFCGYQLSAPTKVKNFNAYGGGFGTRGKVKPGNSLSLDFGAEYSINQQWVLATDIVYSATNRTKFHGTSGQLADGTLASTGSGYSDNLSLSPAIEYNFSPKIGVIAGVWFSVYGRNSSDYVSGILSATFSFP